MERQYAMGQAMGFEIMPHAGLKVPIGRDCAGIQRLELGVFGTVAIQGSTSLGLYPELVDIIAPTGLAVPVQGFRFVRKLRFELVEQNIKGILCAASGLNRPAGISHCFLSEIGVGL